MSENIKKQAIFMPGRGECEGHKTLVRAAERLCEYGGDFDVLHGGPDEYDAGKWELAILLGDKTVPWIKNRLPESVMLEDPDSFAVVNTAESPRAIAATGGSVRGALYAAYCLADKLKSGESLHKLHTVKSPMIKGRYAIVTSTIVAGLYFAPGLFFKTLRELPRYGYNGVVVGAGGQGACLVSDYEFPITADKDGGVKINKYILPEWEDMISKVSEYGMEVILTLPPVTPDFFDEAGADEFYLGGSEPEGYISALSAYLKDFAGNAI